VGQCLSTFARTRGKQRTEEKEIGRILQFKNREQKFSNWTVQFEISVLGF